ncbi:MAG TPA: DinB family protein [Candidatus Angelobacter sp.]|nr:DinB family protein [Candidatus Angelobacter sp.]
MKSARMFYLLLLSLATAAFGQGTPAKNASPQSQATPQAAPTIAIIVDRQVSIVERELVGAAEAMPEDKYNFAPSSLNIPGSEYKSVRTFAQQVKHVAATNFALWGPLVGEKPASDDDDGPASMTSKADIVKYLKDSFALGHRAAKTLTAESSVEMIPSPFGPGQVAKLFCGTFTVAHAFDHYGQIVEYLRMNGIVPPASRGGN